MRHKLEQADVPVAKTSFVGVSEAMEIYEAIIARDETYFFMWDIESYYADPVRPLLFSLVYSFSY